VVSLSRSFDPALRTIIVPRLVLTALGAAGVIGLLAWARYLAGLTLLDDAGYGDSYILYDILHLQKSGHIYRDLSLPPYLPAQYSPLLYIVFAGVNQLFDLSNSFVGPRLLVITAFGACVAVTVSIVKCQVSERRAWVWAIAVIASNSTMWTWLLQLRAEFLGITFSLLAMRLLMSDRRWAIAAAGLCAGMALQFKITFVAAAATGTLWLMWRQQWGSLWRFVTVATVSSVGLYLLYWMREPRMLAQILALAPGVPDPSGAADLLLIALVQPVTAFALIGIPSIVMRNNPHWWLLSGFAGVSFGIAAMTSVQAGAAINYYFEPLFALVPFAVVGVRRLAQRVNAVQLVLCIVVFYFFSPSVQALRDELVPARSVRVRNEDFRALEGVLRQYRIFSTVPRIALIDQAPQLVESFLLSYLLQMRPVDQTPILRPIEEQRFDGVITGARVGGSRGIPGMSPRLHAAIADAYVPYCIRGGLLLHLPRREEPMATRLGRDMTATGCQPTRGPKAPVW
jgi:hypothetical protein